MNASALRIANLAVGLFLVTATWAVFRDVPKAEFLQWDDNYNIFDNPRVQKLDWANVRWMFSDTSYTPRYRPLNWLSWAVNWRFNSNPSAFHWVDLVLHMANALLVFHLVRRLLDSTGDQRSSGSALPSTVCAGAAAMLWAIHPLRVEVVAWANCRMYTQALFFLLLSTLCYLRHAGVPETSPKTATTFFGAGTMYWVSVLLFILSLLTYPIGVTFVIVLLVLNIYPLRRLSSNPAEWFAIPAARRTCLHLLPFLGTGIAVLTTAVWARSDVGAIWVQPNTLSEFSLAHRISQAFYIWAYYVWKPFLPLNLSSSYTMLISFRPWDLHFLISIVLVSGLTLLLIMKRRTWPGALALWTCHLSLLVPMLGLTEHPHAPSDRFSYVVSIVLSIGVAFLLKNFWQHPGARTISLLGVLALAGVSGSASFHQTQVWHDDNSLFRYMISKFDDERYAYDLYRRLGDDYASKGRVREAELNYKKALALYPRYSEGYNALGVLLGKQGRFGEAEDQFTEVLRLNPADANAYANLGKISLERGNFAAAALAYNKALSLQPDHLASHNGLGLVLLRQRKGNEAQAHFQRALELGDDPATSHYNLGNACQLQQKTVKAIAHYHKALRLRPDFPEALNDLAWLLATTPDATLRNGAEAVRLAERAAQLTEHGDAATLDTLAAAYASAGRFDKAVETGRHAESLARSAGNDELVAQINRRMQLYQAGQIYHE